MSEYIKKEDAIKVVQKYAVDEIDGSEEWRSRVNDYLCSVYQDISELPTVSFPEREKGEWEHDESDNSVMCKKCGCFLYPSDISDGEAHFCPNCGADMRGKDNDKV